MLLKGSHGGLGLGSQKGFSKNLSNMAHWPFPLSTFWLLEGLVREGWLCWWEMRGQLRNYPRAQCKHMRKVNTQGACSNVFVKRRCAWESTPVTRQVNAREEGLHTSTNVWTTLWKERANACTRGRLIYTRYGCLNIFVKKGGAWASPNCSPSHKMEERVTNTREEGLHTRYGCLNAFRKKGGAWARHNCTLVHKTDEHMRGRLSHNIWMFERLCEMARCIGKPEWTPTHETSERTRRRLAPDC